MSVNQVSNTMIPQMNSVSLSFDIFSLLTFYTIIASVFFIIIFKLINIEKSFKNKFIPYNTTYFNPYQYNDNYFNNKILNIIEKYLNKEFESKKNDSSNNTKESKNDSSNNSKESNKIKSNQGLVTVDSGNFESFFEKEFNKNKNNIKKIVIDYFENEIKKNKSMKIAPDNFILKNKEYYIPFLKVDNEPVTLDNGGIYFNPEGNFPENVIVF